MREVRKVVEYVADDGTVFQDEAKCLAHDYRLKDMARIMRPLGDQLEYNVIDEGYVQHDPEVVRAVIIDVLRMAKLTIRHKWIDQTMEFPEKCHASWCGRLFSDIDDKIINEAWNRLSCIDWKTGREYQQPYFANNPHEAKGPEVKKP